MINNDPKMQKISPWIYPTIWYINRQAARTILKNENPEICLSTIYHIAGKFGERKPLWICRDRILVRKSLANFLVANTDLHLTNKIWRISVWQNTTQLPNSPK